MAHLSKPINRLRFSLSGSIPDVSSIVAILLIFVALDRGFRFLAALPESSYERPFIFYSFWQHLATQKPLALILIITGIGVVLLFYALRPNWIRNHLERLTQPWPAFTDGRYLRWLCMVAVFLMTWFGTTYDFNLYFDQSHLWDRFLLLLLALMTYWRPVFVYPFLLQFLVVFGQFGYPISFNPSKTEFNFFARFLTLFAAWFLFYVLTGRQRSSQLLFLCCCLLASMYWGPGYRKFQLNWITHPYIHWLHFGAYSAGWLAFLEPSVIVSHVEKLAWVSKPLMAFTLFVEWGALFLLWRRSLFKILLISFIIFHLGIFAVSGMFFWKWILFEVALFTFFIYLKDQPSTAIFKLPYALLSLLIIGGSAIWFQPSTLSWYDTPVSVTYRFEAVGHSGQSYELPSYIFTPYSDMFTLSNFSFLSTEPQLTGLWDITGNRKLADTLRKTSDPSTVFALEPQMGLNRYDPRQKAQLEKFLMRYCFNWNSRGAKRAWFSHLRPPLHLWTHARRRPFREEEPIVRVNIHQVVSFYDGQTYGDIRKRLIHQVDIPTLTR